MKLVARHQKAQGLSNEDISRISGIDAYTLYNLQHHRVYLTRPMYFALCIALGFTPNTPELDSILAQNRKEVGVQSSLVDGTKLEESFELVHLLEKELHSLQVAYDGTEKLRTSFEKLRLEYQELCKEMEELRASYREEIAQAERRGAAQVMRGVEVSKAALEQREAQARIEQMIKDELMPLASDDKAVGAGITPIAGVPQLTVADLV